jgi:molybdopterin converting factor small subunit
MIVKVRGILMRFTDYQSEVAVPGETVRDGLMELCGTYPGLSEVLLDRTGEVRATHLLALNGETLSRDELELPVADDDRVDIVTAISGG